MDIGPVGEGVASAMVGGVASQLGGGKFENGAITATFAYAYNDIYHEFTKDAFGLHMRTTVRDKEGNLLMSMSLGRADGVDMGPKLILGDFFSSNEEYEFGKEGYGKIHVDQNQNEWARIRILSTTPEEDQVIIKWMEAQKGKTGPYGVLGPNCWDQSVVQDKSIVLSVLAKRAGVPLSVESAYSTINWLRQF